MAIRANDVRVSFLTCEPGNEIYTLFGHAAIRYEDPSNQVDWVYNYGMFSFDTPNFIYRFVRGETDYQLGIVPFSYFVSEYALRGSGVYQQTIDLTSDEKRELKRLLDENYLPKNRIYRYNFLYDNCTTRARDIVESVLGGGVNYHYKKEKLSFRDILHESTAGHDWSEFGIDLCLGEEADYIISERQELFAPFYLYEALRGASVVRNDTITPLISSDVKVVDVDSDGEEEEGISFPSPILSAMFLLCCCIGLTIYRVVSRRRVFAWDLFLLILQGSAGCIIAFLVLFSIHPTVSKNWLILVFNPLPLLFLPWTIYALLKNKKEWFHWVNSVCLTLFIIVSPFVVQKFHIAVLPLALSFLINSVGCLVLQNRISRR
ncbi:MAG: DUF4105 domain-containing protein [Phocaeicola sp.]